VATLAAGGFFARRPVAVGVSELNLDATQLDRYSRHVVMDEVGPDGQAALIDASALVVGAGGLGAPALQYLAAAGVGRIGIADDDVVERSNLQRQVVHGDADVGRPKVESARDAVTDLNPDVDVETQEIRVDRDNAPDLIDAYDVVVDASDNFATRYLLNDACVLADTPLCHAAIYRFEGQATTIPAGGGPCYRCLFPEPPEPGTVPDCETTGVLGVLPGTMGCVQATEAIKTIVGVGDPLHGRMFTYDAAGLDADTVPYRATPDCPICGEDPVDSLASDTYEETCAVPE
jgi:molybdopterin/thiamine biosynthesis adenylyltransferase